MMCEYLDHSPPGPALLQAADVQCHTPVYHDPDGPGWEGQSVELWLGRKDSCELEGPLNHSQACQGNSVTEERSSGINKYLRY